MAPSITTADWDIGRRQIFREMNSEKQSSHVPILP